MTNEYVAAAYGVILFALLMYVVAVGLASARRAREAELLAILVERAGMGGEGGVAEVRAEDADAVLAPGVSSRA